MWFKVPPYYIVGTLLSQLKFCVKNHQLWVINFLWTVIKITIKSCCIRYYNSFEYMYTTYHALLISFLISFLYHIVTGKTKFKSNYSSSIQYLVDVKLDYSFYYIWNPHYVGTLLHIRKGSITGLLTYIIGTPFYSNGAGLTKKLGFHGGLLG